MSESDSNLSTTKMALARAHRGDKASPEELEQLRRDFIASKIEATVRRVVADAPPLTDSQIDRIAALLRGSAS